MLYYALILVQNEPPGFVFVEAGIVDADAGGCQDGDGWLMPIFQIGEDTLPIV